jgi:hypothetical protein
MTAAAGSLPVGPALPDSRGVAQPAQQAGSVPMAQLVLDNLLPSKQAYSGSSALRDCALPIAPVHPFALPVATWGIAHVRSHAMQQAQVIGRPRMTYNLCNVQALARTIRYMGLPPERLPAAPDAKFFPGLPPPGTQPTSQPVTRQVGDKTRLVSVRKFAGTS